MTLLKLKKYKMREILMNPHWHFTTSIIHDLSYDSFLTKSTLEKKVSLSF